MSTVNHRMLAAFALMIAIKQKPSWTMSHCGALPGVPSNGQKGLSPLALCVCVRVCAPPTAPFSSRGQTLNTSHTSRNKYCLLLLRFGHRSSKCVGTKNNNKVKQQQKCMRTKYAEQTKVSRHSLILVFMQIFYFFVDSSNCRQKTKNNNNESALQGTSNAIFIILNFKYYFLLFLQLFLLKLLPLLLCFLIY